MYSNTISQSKFLKKIQKKREEMISLGTSCGLLDAKTIYCSQQLDNLLNEYYRLFQEKRTNPKYPLVIKEFSFILCRQEETSGKEYHLYA